MKKTSRVFFGFSGVEKRKRGLEIIWGLTKGVGFFILLLLPFMVKSFKFLTVAFFSFFALAFLARSAVAATLPASSIGVTPASVDLNATTSYTFVFTPATDVGAPGGMVGINFFSMSGPTTEGYLVNLSTATLGSGTTVPGVIDTSSGGPGGDAFLGVQLTSALTAGTSYTVVLNGVVNPSQAGIFQVMLTTNYMGSALDQGTSGNVYIGMGAVTKTVSGRVTYPNGAGVSTAQVSANQKGGGVFLSTTTDSDGNYSLAVPGGIWEVMLSPARDSQGSVVAVDWAYSADGPPPSVNFAQNSVVESATLNFSVVNATATVTGKVIYPDGSIFNQGGINVRGADGVGVGGGIDQDGTFSVQVPAGTYNFSVFSQDPNYAVPSLPSFSVGENATYDLGTITLIRKNEFIKGTVKDKDTGASVAGVEVNAWSPTGFGFGMATTATDGTYTLAVTPGRWEVMARPTADSGYTFEQTGPPDQVDVSANQTVSGKDFLLTKADAAIQGTIVDSNGNQVSDLFAFAMAMRGTDPPLPGPGGEVVGGAFTIAVPAGNYSVNVHMGPDSDYSSLGAESVTVATGETKTVTLTVRKNDAIVMGVVYDPDGNAITGVDLEVGGNSPSGSFKSARVDKTTGRYQMGVVSGQSWYLGVFVDPKSGYMMVPPNDNKVTPSSGETVSKDFTLLKADATINVTVKDPDGNALSNVFVFADSNQGGSSSFEGSGLHTGDLVGSDGTISLNVAAGNWGVGSGAPSALGYINPEVQKISVAKGETKSVTLQYKKSDAQIKGSVTLDGGKTKAFVWAWSEKGGYSQSMSFGGDYTLNVTKDDIWHVGADYESGNNYYRSTEQLVDLSDGSASATQDLVMSAAPWAFPTSLSQTISATQTTTLTLSNGMTISIPANSIASSGNITITVNPTGELAKQKGNRPVGFGYEIKAYNSSGQEITSNFNSDVTITVPYTDAMLTDLGITEDQLTAAYFDSTSSLWQGITSVVVDKDNNKVIVTASHFTPFALVTGSSDTTPPANPTSLTATDAGGGIVNLNWTEPTDSDFAKVYIYRSVVDGVAGDKIDEAAKGTTTYQDSGLSANTTYYYSLKSVDNTGNLSSGTVQVSVLSSGAAANTTTSTTTTDNTITELPATGVGLGHALVFYLQGLLPLLGLVGVRFALLQRI